MISDATRSLKDFQFEVVKKNLELLSDVFDNGVSFAERRVTVSPTGSGKTYMMSTIIQLGLRMYSNSCFVWITHNKQITKQTAENIHSGIAPYICSVEAIESGSHSNARVLLLNVQKGLSKKAIPWLQRWIKKHEEDNRKCVFIVDESDEGQSGLNMQSLRSILKPKLELGFTASFKTESEDRLFHRVPYVDVVRAEMIVDNIYYEVSSEVALREMIKKAIEKRNRLESLTTLLRGTERYFVPKMAIQTQASRAEEMRSLLIDILNLSPEEARKQIAIHTQDERGLDGIIDMNELRFIIGDLMIERGWDMPELYVLLAAKTSLSLAKGVQLLGRVMRLPKAKRFEEEELQALNAGYIYIAGKHSIQKSCEEFMAQGLIPKGGGGFGIEMETINIRPNLKLPTIKTTSGELNDDIWSDKISTVLEQAVEAIFEEINITSSAQPTIRTGQLDLEGMAHAPLTIRAIEAEWNYEHTKDILRNVISKHFPQALCELIIGEFHAEVLSRNLSIAELSSKIRESAQKIKKSQLFRRLSLQLNLKRHDFVWPESINVIKDKSYSFSRCIFPKISGLNNEEVDFSTVLNEVCERKGWYWFRNTPSDILVVKSGYPDFVVLSEDKYVFIEFKGVHLVKTDESVLKNAIGSLGQQNYYMVYKKDKNDDKYYAVGLNSSDEEVFRPEMHLSIYL